MLYMNIRYIISARRIEQSLILSQILIQVSSCEVAAHPYEFPSLKDLSLSNELHAPTLSLKTVDTEASANIGIDLNSACHSQFTKPFLSEEKSCIDLELSISSSRPSNSKYLATDFAL